MWLSLIIPTNTHDPTYKLLSIGGGKSYLFSEPALPSNFPYICTKYFCPSSFTDHSTCNLKSSDFLKPHFLYNSSTL